jgi:hypothetical protein
VRVRRRGALVGLSLVGVVALAGCNSATGLDIPTPTGAVAAATTTTTTPVITVPEPVVPGSTTTTTVAVGPGTATINGTVLGPGGPVEGATVQAERLVGEATATTEATTAADGSFSIPGILGGRYRLRAWQAPSLAMTTPQIFFLAATDTRTVSLQLTSYGGLKITSAINPTTVFTGGALNLAIDVTQATVDQTGEVSQAPQASVSVTLSAPGYAVTDGSGGQGTTDAQGEVVFALSCLNDGPEPISVTAGSSTTADLPTPDCLDPESTTTTTTTLPGSTSTTVAGSPTTVSGGSPPTTLSGGSPPTAFPPA